MSATISSPQFSFVRFGEPDSYEICTDAKVNICLPVYQYDDVAFQWLLRTSTKAEADQICTDNTLVEVSLVDNCDDLTELLNFSTLPYPLYPEIVRIGEKTLVFNWTHGFPGFDGVVALNKCFAVRVVIHHPTIGDITACSNCFERISDPCFTSMLEYGCEENALGFYYCGSADVEEIANEPCPDPMIITFDNVPNISIPYTPGMAALYGAVPTIEVWILDAGAYIKPVIRVGFDAYPPTTIIADLGGLASGFIKIS